jgi:DNA-binding NtrC family response regulator
MTKLSTQLGMPPVVIDSAARAAMASYDWPGNVRELRNLIERTLILGAFPYDFSGPRSDGQPAAADSLEDLERRHILAVLKETGGNREEAARRLGISRKTIDRKCARWNV